MTKLLLIFLAGGVGSLARYLLSGWVQRQGTESFPLGTLVINILGCFLIGFLTEAFSGRILLREEHRIMITVGFIGGFTTFSTFGLETFTLLDDGQLVRATLNVVLSVGLGLFAVWFGYRLAQYWLGV
jgi:fluoride exporter